MTLHRRRLGILLLVAPILVSAASRDAVAARVRLDPPVHRDGQTFLTWTSVNGPGTTYRVYTSSDPITNTADLLASTLVGSVRDSTWCDRRLSAILGNTYAFRIDSVATPLAPDQGLFVVTPPVSRNAYYAVTSQLNGGAEEFTITPGWNTLQDPVNEQLGTPRPVYQRTLPVGPGVDADIYTLWTTDHATPLFPAMANRSSLPFDCGVARGGVPPQSSLLISMHARGSNFFQGVYSTGHPGEWVLALDDPVETRELNTFWYGYHRSYDPFLYTNPVPNTGVVEDYTMRRVIHTVLWARSRFPVDTTRVYTYGISMGAIGGMLAALRRADLFGAVLGIAGKYDFSFITDPDPTSGFNPGNVLRDNCDRLWGTVGQNLESSEGLPVYEELSDGFKVGQVPSAWIPPVIEFSGKNDLVVGWAEKIPFFQAMRDARKGGAFFWDTRDHLNNTAAAWSPMQDPQYVYRFRTDLSFPALSSCSTDQDPGDGTAASGDSVGGINIHLEWDTTLVDQSDRWQTTLRLRDLTTLWGPVPAPESCTVDVTPRRLQAFLVVPDSAYAYQVTRLDDGAVVQEGTQNGDVAGVLTIPGVKVYRSGSRLTIQALGDYQGPPAAVGDPAQAARPAIALAPNPARGSPTVRVSWPARAAGGARPARVDLFDLGGREVRTLWAGPAAGTTVLRIDRGGLPAGLYFVAATQGGIRSIRRLVLLN